QCHAITFSYMRTLIHTRRSLRRAIPSFTVLLAATNLFPASPGPGSSISFTAIGAGIVPWQTTGVMALVLSGLILSAFAFHRYRLYKLAQQMSARFEERLEERSRVALDLHDTMLQGFLSASMRLHLLAEHLPEDSSEKDAIGEILAL